jgi:sec-independent protein translocase protein TatA
MGLKVPELLIIGFVVVLLFGGSKLPQLGAGLGQGIRSFKKALAGDEEKPATPASNDQAPKA